MTKNDWISTAMRVVLIFVASMVFPSLAWSPLSIIPVLLAFALVAKGNHIFAQIVTFVLVVINTVAICSLLLGQGVVYALAGGIVYLLLYFSTFIIQRLH